jgi:acyl carrier protein
MATLTTNGVLQAVTASIAETLGLDDDAVSPDARLAADLGAGCFELIEMLRRIDSRLGVRLTLAELGAHGRLRGEPLLPETRPWLRGDALMIEAEDTCGRCTVADLVAAISDRLAVAR